MQEMSLKQVVDRAIEYSPQIRLQKNEKVKLEHEYRSVLGTALPNIKANYTVSNYLTKPSYGGFSLNSTYERSTGIEVSQTLYSFGAVSGALKAADAALDISKLSQELTGREVEYAAKVAFYSVLLAEKQLEIAQNSLGNAKSNLSILQGYFSTGRPPQGDLIRLKADVAARHPQVEEAKSNLNQANSRLKTLLGLPEERVIKLSGGFAHHLPKLKVEDLIEKLESNEPQLKVLDKQIKYADSFAKIQRSKMLPQLGAFYAYNVSGRSEDEIFGNDSSVESSVVGVSVSWSLWDGGTTMADYRKAKAIKVEAELQKVQQRDQLILALQEKVQEYSMLKVNLENDSKSVALAKESFRLSQNRFKTGKTSVTELNSAEALLNQTLLTEALHKFRINESYAAIRKIVQDVNGR